MKKFLVLIVLLSVSMFVHAQNKVWLSGYHSNASIRYLYDGEYSNIDAVWEGGSPKNNAYVVVYGQFRKDNSGRAYFSIEKSSGSVTLFSGNFSKANYKCPVTKDEGQIITSSGSKITYTSFVPLNAQGTVNVSKAEWGIKVCEGKVYNVYYIRSINGNAGQVAQEQQVIAPEYEASEEEKSITGKVIGLEKPTALNVKNYALFLCDDGSKIEISSSRPMKVGEKVTLQGTYKTVYWDGIMKTSEIFEVKKIITAVASTVNSGAALSVDLTEEETELYNLIMQYRRERKLPAIPVSKSLSYVAKVHARDLQDNYVSGSLCNMHSWSDKGNWSACCYTADHAQAKGMWEKPRELTNYKGNGFEIAYWNGGTANAAGALKSWKNSSGHNAVIINDGTWANSTWKAIGIGIYNQYALVWFGEETDNLK